MSLGDASLESGQASVPSGGASLESFGMDTTDLSGAIRSFAAQLEQDSSRPGVYAIDKDLWTGGKFVLHSRGPLLNSPGRAPPRHRLPQRAQPVLSRIPGTAPSRRTCFPGMPCLYRRIDIYTQSLWTLSTLILRLCAWGRVFHPAVLTVSSVSRCSRKTKTVCPFFNHGGHVCHGHINGNQGQPCMTLNDSLPTGKVRRGQGKELVFDV